MTHEGLHPSVNSKYLSRNYAVKALNTRLWDGSVRAFRTPLKVSNCTGQTLDVSGDPITVKCHPDKRCLVDAGTPCGDTERLFVNGGTLTRADGTRVGASRPEQVPTVVGLGGTTTLFVRVMCLDAAGNFSAPSKPSTVASVTAGEKFRLTWTGCTPFRAQAYLTKGQAGEFKVGEPHGAWVDIGDFTASGDVTFNPAGWDLTSTDYDADDYCDPPEFDCLVYTEDGFYVGWKGNTIWVSERNQPALWRLRDIYKRPYRILAGRTARAAVYFATTGVPDVMVVQPTKDGAAVQFYRGQENYPAVNGAAVGMLNGGMVYASRTGLVAVDQSGQPVQFTKNIINEDDYRKDWQPSVLGVQRGVVFAFSDTRSWLYDAPDRANQQVQLGSLVEISPRATAVAAPTDGELYYSDANGTYIWDAGDRYMAAVWESKPYRLPSHTLMAAVRVLGQHVEQATVTIIADGAEVHRFRPDPRCETIRVPRCVQGRVFQFRYELPESGVEIAIQETLLATSIDVMQTK